MPWQNAIKTDVLADGRGVSLILPGRRKPVAVFRYADQYFAVADECTHSYAPLADSLVQDYLITCSWHGARFDLRTGEGVGALAYAALRTFPVRVTGVDVQVEI